MPTIIPTNSANSTSGATTAAAANVRQTASVFEFRCLYTHDVRRKAKRWRDGYLSYHLFNKRVMVFDDERNFIGDTHRQEDAAVEDGDSLTLKDGIIVDVGERLGRTETDVTEIVQRKKPKEQVPTKDPLIKRAKPLAVQTSMNANRGATALLPQSRHKTLNSLLGARKGPVGKVVFPDKSPFEQRQEPAAAVPSPTTERPRKRARVSENGTGRPAIVPPRCQLNDPTEIIDLDVDTPDRASRDHKSQASSRKVPTIRPDVPATTSIKTNTDMNRDDSASGGAEMSQAQPKKTGTNGLRRDVEISKPPPEPKTRSPKKTANLQVEQTVTLEKPTKPAPRSIMPKNPTKRQSKKDVTSDSANEPHSPSRTTKDRSPKPDPRKKTLRIGTAEPRSKLISGRVRRSDSSSTPTIETNSDATPEPRHLPKPARNRTTTAKPRHNDDDAAASQPAQANFKATPITQSHLPTKSLPPPRQQDTNTISIQSSEDEDGDDFEYMPVAKERHPDLGAASLLTAKPGSKAVEPPCAGRSQNAPAQSIEATPLRIARTRVAEAAVPPSQKEHQRQQQRKEEEVKKEAASPATEPQLGPWTEEAYDLLDWRPPWNRKAVPLESTSLGVVN